MMKSRLIHFTFAYRRRSYFIVLILLLSLFVVACTGASDSTGSADETTAEQTSGNAAATDQLGTEEFGMTKQELVENIEKVEGLIAKCMSEAGFEYLAVDYDTARRGMTADKRLPNVSDEDFIAQYGYGISTLYTGQAPQNADASSPAQIGLGEQNVQIFKKLSAADQVAYSRALFGENEDATFAVTLEAEDFSRTGGCTRQAIEQVFTSEELKSTYINPLDIRIDQDKRVIEALAKFSDCVREAGFNYNNPDEIEDDIKAKLDAITNGMPLEALSSEAREKLSELQGEERALAGVATECEETIVEPVRVQVQQEL